MCHSEARIHEDNQHRIHGHEHNEFSSAVESKVEGKVFCIWSVHLICENFVLAFDASLGLAVKW